MTFPDLEQKDRPSFLVFTSGKLPVSQVLSLPRVLLNDLDLYGSRCYGVPNLSLT